MERVIEAASNLEQAETGAENMARLIGAFYQELRDQGLTEETLCILTNTFLQHLLDVGKKE